MVATKTKFQLMLNSYLYADNYEAYDRQLYVCGCDVTMILIFIWW